MHTTIVNGVVWRVVSVRLTGNYEFAAGHDLVCAVRFVIDLGKMNGHTAAIHIGEHLWIVYQHRQLLATNFIRPIAEHKQHWIDDIRLATSVWTDNRVEALKCYVFINYRNCENCYAYTVWVRIRGPLRCTFILEHLRDKMDRASLRRRSFWNCYLWFVWWSSGRLSTRSSNAVWWVVECKCRQLDTRLTDNERKTLKFACLHESMQQWDSRMQGQMNVPSSSSYIVAGSSFMSSSALSPCSMISLLAAAAAAAAFFFNFFGGELISPDDGPLFPQVN